MIVFITGGARSGKSSYAQKRALELGKKPIYLATSNVDDEEFAERVRLHKLDRGEGWRTIEAYQNLDQLPLENEIVVVDCVTLWLTNFFMNNKQNIETSLTLFKKEIDHLEKLKGTYFIISNEIGMGLHAETLIGRKFTDLQGWANQYIASKSKEAIFMVSGLPVYLKDRSL